MYISIVDTVPIAVAFQYLSPDVVKYYAENKALFDLRHENKVDENKV